jgi:hypothetical protein
MISDGRRYKKQDAHDWLSTVLGKREDASSSRGEAREGNKLSKAAPRSAAAT